jgi:hypothetical protein
MRKNKTLHRREKHKRRAWGQTLFLAWLDSLQKKRPACLHARNNVRPRVFPFEMFAS